MPRKATSEQVGGSHYKDLPIQPAEFIHKNKIGFLPGNIIKYAVRYQNKGGRQDLEKIIHYARLIIEMDYGEAFAKDACYQKRHIRRTA